MDFFWDYKGWIIGTLLSLSGAGIIYTTYLKVSYNIVDSEMTSYTYSQKCVFLTSQLAINRANKIYDEKLVKEAKKHLDNIPVMDAAKADLASMVLSDRASFSPAVTEGVKMLRKELGLAMLNEGKRGL